MISHPPRPEGSSHRPHSPPSRARPPRPVVAIPPIPNRDTAPHGRFWGTRGSASGRAGPRGRARSGSGRGGCTAAVGLNGPSSRLELSGTKINQADLAVRGLPSPLALGRCWAGGAGRHFPLAFLPRENGAAVSGVSALPG